MFILQQIKKENTEQAISTMIEDYLEYEKSIQKYEETTILTNAEFIGNWGITLAEFDENNTFRKKFPKKGFEQTDNSIKFTK